MVNLGYTIYIQSNNASFRLNLMSISDLCLMSATWKARSTAQNRPGFRDFPPQGLCANCRLGLSLGESKKNCGGCIFGKRFSLCEGLTELNCLFSSSHQFQTHILVGPLRIKCGISKMVHREGKTACNAPQVSDCQFKHIYGHHRGIDVGSYR